MSMDREQDREMQVEECDRPACVEYRRCCDAALARVAELVAELERERNPMNLAGEPMFPNPSGEAS